MKTSGFGYIASAGETFDLIALNVFGNEKYAAEIMCVNPELCEKTMMEGGEAIYLPSIQEENEQTAPWKRG